jgi:hypothetical protein
MKERIFIRKVGDTANGNHLEMWDERSVFLKHDVMTVRGKEDWMCQRLLPDHARHSAMLSWQ